MSGCDVTCCVIFIMGFWVNVRRYGENLWNVYKESSSIAFDEKSSYWSAPKTPYFSAFHWSPCGSLVSIGQHFVATRVVHLPKSTKTSLITESDQSGSNHQLLQLCTTRTAWSESDQAVRAVHSCNSWLLYNFQSKGSLKLNAPGVLLFK